MHDLSERRLLAIRIAIERLKGERRGAGVKQLQKVSCLLKVWGASPCDALGRQARTAAGRRRS